MRKLLVVVSGLLLLASCNRNGKSSEGLTVSGKITNNRAKIITLEKVPNTTMEPVTVATATIGKDGSYELQAPVDEPMIYNLRLDENRFPVASIINDTKEVEVNIELPKDSSEFALDYTVKGSPSSQQMKDYISHINTELQKVYNGLMKEDTLRRQGASDSAVQAVSSEREMAATGIRNYALATMDKAPNATLLLFELGYYQSSANNPNLKLPALDITEVAKIVNDGVKKFPDHKAIADIGKSIDSELAKAEGSNLVGKPAPDFTLPDANGKQVALSSFKGKYVLVDFWASWCQPCRYENPTVLGAYNKYKDRNFTVLGVSLDKPGEKDKWLAAVKQDGLPWTQVSELKWWDSEVVGLYGFNGIPFNVLLDPSGKVIAQELRGPDLEAKLAEVIK